jgi:autotransporter-associated beta strand protein
VISDGGNNRGFVFQGGGTLALNGANTFAGGITHTAGSISINNGAGLGTGTYTVGAGVTGSATLDSPPSAFLTVANTAAVTVANNIVLPAPAAATAYTIVKNSASATTGTQLNFTGNLTGGGANTKLFLNSNTGGDTTTTYRLAGNNTFTATVELWRGGIVVASANALGNPTNLIRLDGNNNTTLGDLRFEVGGTFANPFELVSDGPINPNANAVELSGVVSGTTPFVKIGAGTLTLSGANTYTSPTTVSVGTLRIGNGGTSGTLGTGDVTNNASLSFNRSDSSTVSNVISGTGTVVQAGTGTTVLTGVNTFTGPLVVNAGTLAIGSTGSIATTTVTVNSGGVLDVSAPFGFTIPVGTTLTVGRTGSAATDVVGSLTVAGTLSVGGTGTARTASFGNDLTLNAAQVNFDLSNATTVGGGVNDLVRIAGNLSLTGTTGININQTNGALASGTYTLFQYVGTLTGTTANLQLNGLSSGTTRQTFNLNAGSGTNSAITLGVTGSPADLTWVGNAGNNVWDLVQTANWTGAPGATPDNRFYNLDTVTFTQTGVGGATAVNLTAAVNPGSVTVNATQDYTISGSGSIIGTGGLTKQGTGTLVLATNNTFTGAVTLSAGTLQIGTGGTTGSIAANVTDNAALVFNRSDALTYAGVISGSGTVSQIGAGVLTLSGVNSYAGATTVTGGGTLAITADANLGTAPGAATPAALVLNNGTLSTTGSFALAAARGLAAGPTSGSGGATINVTSGTLTYNGVLANNGAGTGSLTKTGAGTLLLGGANTYSGGTTLSAGALAFSSNTAFGTGPVTTGTGVVSSTTLTSPPGPFLNASGATSLSLANNIVLPAPAAATAYTFLKDTGGQVDLTGVISGGNANAKIFFNTNTAGDSTTTFRLSGTNTFLATVELWRGAFVATNSASFGDPTNLVRMDGNNNTTLGDLRFDTGVTLPNPVELVISSVPIGTAGNAATLSGLVTGVGGINKLGAGTLTLTAANTFAGNSVVNGGVLAVNGNHAAVTGTTTVNNTGTLAGTGTLGGPVTVNSGGTVRGGTDTGTGTLTTANVTVASGGALLANLSAPGTASQLALGANTLNLATGSVLRLTGVTGFNPNVGGTYTLATTSTGNLQLDGATQSNGFVFGSYVQGTGATGPVTIDTSALGATIGTGSQLNLSVSGTNLVLQFTPVPEPITGLAVGFGVVALGWVRRSRRSVAPAA